MSSVPPIEPVRGAVAYHQQPLLSGVRPAYVGPVFAMARAECESAEPHRKLDDGLISHERWDVYVSRVAHGQLAPDAPMRGTDSSRATQQRSA